MCRWVKTASASRPASSDKSIQAGEGQRKTYNLFCTLVLRMGAIQQTQDSNTAASLVRQQGNCSQLGANVTNSARPNLSHTTFPTLLCIADHENSCGKSVSEWRCENSDDCYGRRV